jgi:hypothetical protein
LEFYGSIFKGEEDFNEESKPKISLIFQGGTTTTKISLGVKKYETIGDAILFLWKNGRRKIN